VERLGRAMTQRHKYLEYRERHRAKLSQDLDVAQDAGPAATVIMSNTVVTEMRPGVLDSMERSSDSGRSETSYAPALAGGGNITIPTPPADWVDGEPFECPYCFVMISVYSTRQWNKHVFLDLQPYVCTVPSCATRTSCIPHGTNGFIVSNLAHPEYGKTKVDMSGSLADYEQAHDKFYAGYPRCPSIFEGERRFKIHLTRYLQELASLVLPSDDADSDFEESRVEAEDAPAQEKSSDGDSGESAEDTDPQLDSENWGDIIFSTSGNDVDMR
jgi:hypothetical protein